MTRQPPGTSGWRRFWLQLLAVVQWIAAREMLSSDDVQKATPRIGVSPLAWLVSPDQLPNRALPRRTRLGLVPWLVSREKLQALSQAPRERSFLGWLIAREDLSAASSKRATATRSIFRWLLTPESHDRLERRDSTKEVPPHAS